MDMIAMLNGLGWTYPVKADAKQPAADADAAAAEVTRRIKAMDDTTLLTYAHAAMNDQPYGNISADRLRAVSAQLFAEVVARFGPAKLAELGTPESSGGGKMAVGLLVLAVGAGAVWWYMKRRQQ